MTAVERVEALRELHDRSGRELRRRLRTAEQYHQLHLLVLDLLAELHAAIGELIRSERRP